MAGYYVEAVLKYLLPVPLAIGNFWQIGMSPFRRINIRLHPFIALNVIKIIL